MENDFRSPKRSLAAFSPLAAIATSCVALVLLTGFTAVDVTGGTTGDGEIPLAGTFEHFQNRESNKTVVRGGIHAVQRVPGGTALYYSVGTPPGSGERYKGLKSFRSMPGLYTEVTGDIYVADLENGKLYRPVYEKGANTVTRTYDLEANEGELVTGFAMFPELDADAEIVQVGFGPGGNVIDVLVGEGELTPIADGPGALLGEGWPQLPSESELAQFDPAEFTRKIGQRFEDIEGAAQIDETATEVHVTLDANVVFAVDKWDLSGKAKERLDSVAADISARGVGEVEIVGHTDSVGAKDHNQKLSERRAKSVEKYLQSEISDADVTFKSVGKGESDPIASNSDDEGRAQNRRVEITYQVVEGQ